MPVRVHARAHVVVISANGDLDLVSRALLDAAVDSALAGTWRLIVVDLAELAFVDVVGAKPLLRLAASLSGDRQLLIVNASPAISDTLQWLRLDAWLLPLEQLPLATDEELAELLQSGS